MDGGTDGLQALALALALAMGADGVRSTVHHALAGAAASVSVMTAVPGSA